MKRYEGSDGYDDGGGGDGRDGNNELTICYVLTHVPGMKKPQ